MGGPFERSPQLEADIVTTTAWVTMEAGRIGLCFTKGELPRTVDRWDDATSHGELGIGWRITLPTGEQAIVTDYYEAWAGVVAELDAGADLPLMRERLLSQAKREAFCVEVKIERLDENVRVLTPKES